MSLSITQQVRYGSLYDGTPQVRQDGSALQENDFFTEEDASGEHEFKFIVHEEVYIMIAKRKN